MKILADENIPYVHDFFDRFGDVRTTPGRHISSAQLKDVDVLLVRSVTNVNEQLLHGSKLQFVGTCTIGTDHLDKEYLTRNHIAFASAPGCNAGGVIQYDLAALASLDSDWEKKRIGVIGNGNVGSRLCKTLQALNISFCAYDPFLSNSEFNYLTDIDEVFACDIVCVHTPYTTAGPHPTHHMIGRKQLDRLGKRAILLNAGRGGALDNQALLDFLKVRDDVQVVLDVWEHEPNINLELLPYVAIATPHIAGYSFEGKLMGNAMIYHALVDFLGLDAEVFGEQCHRLLDKLKGPRQKIAVATLNDGVQQTYHIAEDDRRTRQALQNIDADLRAATFDELRKHYLERREFGHFKIQSDHARLATTLQNIGFTLDD